MFTAQSTPAPIPVVSIDPDVVELDDNGRAWFAELADARRAEAEAAERKAVARRNLEAILGDRTTATIGGRQAVTWKTTATRSFDKAAARELLTNEQWEACQRTGSTRTFKVTD